MTQRDRGRELLAGLLGDEEWRPSAWVYAIGRREGISPATLRRAAKDLGVEIRRLPQPAAPTEWRLPPFAEEPLRSLRINDAA